MSTLASLRVVVVRGGEEGRLVDLRPVEAVRAGAASRNKLLCECGTEGLSIWHTMRFNKVPLHGVQRVLMLGGYVYNVDDVPRGGTSNA